jgi:hypothetical protein
MKHAVVCLPILLAACQSPSQRYVGPVTGCGETTRGLLDLQNGHFVFTPTETVLSIKGSVAADGTLQGSGALPGPAAPTLQFVGRRTGQGIIGTLTGGRCSKTVELAPAKSGFDQSLPSRSVLTPLFAPNPVSNASH